MKAQKEEKVALAVQASINFKRGKNMKSKKGISYKTIMQNSILDKFIKKEEKPKKKED